MSLLRHIPNALTLCNLLCGCLGIMLIVGANERDAAGGLVLLACVFDFLDGFAARLLKVSSPIGKELDSLADMVTFGILPSLYMVSTLSNEISTPWIYLGLLIAVCSAIRLAKFNVDDRQTDGFIGVPTPAMALFVTNYGYLQDMFLGNLTSVSVTVLWVIPVVVTLLFSWLMVSPIRLFALKFKHFKWSGNELRFTFLIAAVLLIGFFNAAGFALAIILYILASLVTGWRQRGAGA